GIERLLRGGGAVAIAPSAEVRPRRAALQLAGVTERAECGAPTIAILRSECRARLCAIWKRDAARTLNLQIVDINGMRPREHLIRRWIEVFALGKRANRCAVELPRQRTRRPTQRVVVIGLRERRDVD